MTTFDSTSAANPGLAALECSDDGTLSLLDGLENVTLHVDVDVPHLVDCTVKRNEGVVASNGALCVETGARTGRSPRDRYIVDQPVSSPHIDWGLINRSFPAAAFERLWQRVTEHVRSRGELFVSHLYAGSDLKYRLPIKVITEYAWHNLFARQLFVRPAHRDRPEEEAEWTILNAPDYTPDPARDGTASDGAVILDLAGKRILLCGMRYAGEMKKAVFSVLNYLLPDRDVLPMHCAANVGEHGDVALFFGLSGTGKTTLSADPERYLIGDDEHGWSDEGIFNFEGGCYAKCINLNPDKEPVIHKAIRFGSVMENVVLDAASRNPLYDDDSLTQNTRVAYPREFVDMRMPGNRAGHPQAVIFLTCDLYGVLPPVALLNREQVAFYFMSGYTALVGSTEMGHEADAIKPTFSACFGAPFFPRKAEEYARLLMHKVERHGSDVFLVNTGWTGGEFGRGGHRFDIPVTRAVIRAIVNGDLHGGETRLLPELNLAIPDQIPGIEAGLLDPRAGWSDPRAYAAACRKLGVEFRRNFAKFGDGFEHIARSGPRCAL
jgi:phosphoenolpyruvate carboxykinase (ATP)